MRKAQIQRKTAETDICLELNVDGGAVNVDSGVGFFDHMLTLFAAHGGFGLAVACKGDTRVDGHHSVEDIGIALGTAFAETLGDKRGIARYGSVLLPMDEALVQIALDISGRCGLYWEVSLPAPKVGGFDTELVKEFLLGLCRAMSLTLHVRQLAGENTHHIIEAVFKGLGRALRAAVAIDPARAGEIPSTKGVI